MSDSSADSHPHRPKHHVGDRVHHTDGHSAEQAAHAARRELSHEYGEHVTKAVAHKKRDDDGEESGKNHPVKSKLADSRTEGDRKPALVLASFQGSGNGKSEVLPSVRISGHDNTAETKPGAATAPRDLSSHKDQTPTELAKAGLLKDGTKQAEIQKTVPAAGPNEQPGVKVEFEDKSKPHQTPADFVVHNDGSITMNDDPEKRGYKGVTVRVERNDGQVKPTEAQDKAVQDLTQYLAQRIKQTNPQMTTPPVLDDPNSLVRQQTERQSGMAPPQSERSMSPESREAVHRMGRFHGSGGGHMPSRDTGDYIPERSVPPSPHEGGGMVATKDAVAGIFNPDKQNPYGTIRTNSDGSHSVGRYGISAKMLDWFANLTPEELQKLIAEGKISPEMAQKMSDPNFRKEMQEFAQQLGPGGSEEAIKSGMSKFLTGKQQEDIASAAISRIDPNGTDPGKVAQMFAARKSPTEQLTPQEANAPAMKEIHDAAERLAGMSSAKQLAGPEGQVAWTADGQMMPIDSKGHKLAPGAAQAFLRAQEMAHRDGVEIKIESAYRSYEQQARIWEESGHGARFQAARPGHSNHQSGNAVDIGNWQQAAPYLEAAGFFHGDWHHGRGYRMLQRDPGHFAFRPGIDAQDGGGGRNA